MMLLSRRLSAPARPDESASLELHPRPPPPAAQTNRGATLAEDLRQDLAVIEAAGRETLAQHDRLMLAKKLLARKGRGRRQTSALP